MSTFSYTECTVICNGVGEDGRPCPRSERTDTLDLMDGTAVDVRKILRRRGWVVNVPNPDPTARTRRLDFCPAHKVGAARLAADRAGSGFSVHIKGR